jgi:hypothetical protein
MLSNTPGLFVQQHALELSDQLAKFIRSGPPDPPLLQTVVQWFQALPEDYLETKHGDFDRAVLVNFLPMIVPEKEAKLRVHYTTPELRPIVVSILAEIGIRDFSYASKICKHAFAPAERGIDSRLKSLRLLCIQTLAKITELNPEVTAEKNDSYMSWMQPILLKQPLTVDDEFEAAVGTFPRICPTDTGVQCEIAHTLFEMVKSQENGSTQVFHSLCQFIASTVTLSNNARLPVAFMRALLEDLASRPVQEVLRNFILLVCFHANSLPC